MHFYPNERIALFIDGANLYSAAKALQFDIDYKRLLALFRQKGQLVRALYYTALAEDQEYSSIRPLIDWLDYNGYSMVTKPTKEFTDSMGRRKLKGNMDIELAVDAMRLSESIDHIVIFSGDGDFKSLVAALQQKGRRVSVVSTLQTQPPMVADELRRQADQFIDLADLEQMICRDASGRPARTDPRWPGGRPDRVRSHGVYGHTYGFCHPQGFARYFTSTRMPWASARSTPPASTFVIGITALSEPLPLAPLTCITPNPGTGPVELCGSPVSGFGPRKLTKIRLPEGERSPRSGVTSIPFNRMGTVPV